MPGCVMRSEIARVEPSVAVTRAPDDDLDTVLRDRRCQDALAGSDQLDAVADRAQLIGLCRGRLQLG